MIRKRLLENKMITEETYKAMRCKSVRPGRFYILPKIHKLNHLGRPIVSCTVLEHLRKKYRHLWIMFFLRL